LWNHYNSKSPENYNANATISFSSYPIMNHESLILNLESILPILWSLFWFKYTESGEQLQLWWFQYDHYYKIGLFLTNWPTRKYISIHLSTRARRIWLCSWDLENGHIVNMRKSCSKNPTFLSIQVEFVKTILL